MKIIPYFGIFNLSLISLRFNPSLLLLLHPQSRTKLVGRSNFSSPFTVPVRSMASAVFHTSNSIEKPDLDDREYKIVRLPNNLTALLISDPTTDKSAAALDVNVGSFNDYDHLPGLAHFCEHLLFMGTKKYPSENEYSSYLSNHGGHSNAYTSTQSTNYHFEINHSYLEGALDRFSQFFIAPLFDPSCKDREINAVDSENKKNLQNDLWRLRQLDKSLSNPAHPYHKFSTGNAETLGKIPESQGIDVRDELLKFYKENYSSNLMKLVVLGRESVDILEKWVNEKFTDVPNYSRPIPEFEQEIFSSNELQKLIKAKPVMNRNKLDLTFVVPDHDEHWESSSSHYFSHLIGHEGTGSLLAFLKSKGWANGLSAGGYSISKNNGVFGIDIDLTEDGLKNYKEILIAAFQYIELLKLSTPQKWIFDELRDISEMEFKFKQKISPLSTASKLAKDLQRIYIPDQFLLSRYVLRKYSPELLTEFVQSLKVENSRITLVSQEVETDQKEKWYGTDYSISDIPLELVSKLKSPILNAQLTLPAPNEFIPTNFEVERSETLDPAKKPSILLSNKNFRIWYKKDDQFWVPKAFIQVYLSLPLVSSSPYNFVLSALFAELVEDALKETSYQASIAGLTFSLGLVKDGFSISVHGFNEKAPLLFKHVLDEILKFEPTVDRFAVIKETVLRNYKNFGLKAPYTQISNVYYNLLNENSWPVEEKLASLKVIEFEDLKSFIPLLFKQAFAEALIHGNFDKAQALEISNIIQNSINFQSLTDSQKIKPRSYALPQGKSLRYEKILEDDQNINNCIQYYIQIGDIADLRLLATSELLIQLIQEPAFNILRTKEQLGYIVFTGILEDRTQFGARIIIQSERSTGYLESRIVNFFKTYESRLNELTEEEFERNKEALIAKKQEKLKNLTQENARFNYAILNGTYDFTQKQKTADILKTISKEEFIKFYEQYILSITSNLIINLNAKHPKNATDEAVGFPTGEVIEDIGSFKSSLFLAPAPKPVESLTVKNFGSKL